MHASSMLNVRNIGCHLKMHELEPSANTCSCDKFKVTVSIERHA